VKREWLVVTWCVSLACVVGCVGQFTYQRPGASDVPLRSVTVPRGLDQVWRDLPATLNGGPYLLQRLDPTAGIAVLSYRGDPARYVDCGQITSYVRNVRGERVYRFAAATASVEYELVTGKEILVIDRQMTLDGDLTLTIAAVGANSTQVSASARYVLTRTLVMRDVLGRVQTVSHLAEFGGEREGSLPGLITCRATGAWEYDVFSRLPK
jgi:hypothetical protein